jgi:hypothetical protein
MIRTWGYGIAGEDQSATGNNAFGVFQFYRHTLAMVVHGGSGADGALLAKIVVRAIHDAAKGVQEDDDEIEALQTMVQAAEDQSSAVREKYELSTNGVGVSLFWVSAEAMWFAQVGPAVAFHVRGKRGKRIGVLDDVQRLGRGAGVRPGLAGPAQLEANDVLVIASISAAEQVRLRSLVTEDWAMPQRAVRRVLEGVHGAAVNDTVLLAVAMNKSPEFIRPTVPPNMTLLLQELLARKGREDAREAVFREVVEEVKPEWRKANVVKHDTPVKRDRLEFKESEKDDDEEEEEISGWDQFVRGFIILRDKAFQAFRSEKGRRQMNMVSAVLASLFALLLMVGVFVDMEELAEQQNAPPQKNSDAYEVAEGRLIRQPAPVAAPKSAPRAAPKPTPRAAPKPGTGGRGGAGLGLGAGSPAKPSKKTGKPGKKEEAVEAVEVSPWRRLGGLVLLGGAAVAGMLWRRKQIEDAQRERDRLGEQQLRSLLERAIVGQGGSEVGQKLVGTDGHAAIATLVTAGATRDLILLVNAPKKLRQQDPSEDLSQLSRPSTRVVSPASIIDVCLVQNRGHKSNKQGGRRVEWIERVELQLRLADPGAPDHRVSFLHDATPPGTLAHFEAIAEAHHWEGVIMAQMHSSRRQSTGERLAALRPLVKRGLVSSQEVALVKAGLSRRRSGYLKVG